MDVAWGAASPHRKQAGSTRAPFAPRRRIHLMLEPGAPSLSGWLTCSRLISLTDSEMRSQLTKIALLHRVHPVERTGQLLPAYRSPILFCRTIAAR